jgi:hypothetical protein
MRVVLGPSPKTILVMAFLIHENFDFCNRSIIIIILGTFFATCTCSGCGLGGRADIAAPIYLYSITSRLRSRSRRGGRGFLSRLGAGFQAASASSRLPENTTGMRLFTQIRKRSCATSLAATVRTNIYRQSLQNHKKRKHAIHVMYIIVHVWSHAQHTVCSSVCNRCVKNTLHTCTSIATMHHATTLQSDS